MDEHEEELRPPFYNDKEMYKMTQNKLKVLERDELLIRLDERTRNIWKLVEKLETHQAEANGFIKDNLIRSSSNRTWINVLRWTIGGLITALGVMWSKFQGWW